MENRKTFFQKTGVSNLIDKIVSKCLWHEPHSLSEIVQKLDSGNESLVSSRGESIKRIWSALATAIASGYIQKKEGYFVLTVPGRAEYKDKIFEPAFRGGLGPCGDTQSALA